jgi:hypothetical protein
MISPPYLTYGPGAMHADRCTCSLCRPALNADTLFTGECPMPDWKELRSVCLELAAEKHGPMPCAAGCNCRKCRDDAMFRSLERQNEFYQKNPRSIPGDGFTTPYGVEEQYRVEAEKRRRREAGVPE